MKKITSITAAMASITILLSPTATILAQPNDSSLIQDLQVDFTLDQKIKKLLIDNITELAGKSNKPNIQFVSVDTSFDEWVVNGTVDGAGFADFIQRYDPQNGRVTSTNLSYDASDMNKVLDNALRLKISSFLKTFENELTFIPGALWRVNDPMNEGGFKNYWVIWGPSQSLYIDVDNNNQLSAMMQYKIEDAYDALTNQARNSLKSLGIKSNKAFDYVVLTKEGKDTLWKYRDDDYLNYAYIGYNTGKVWKVTNELGMDWNGDADFKRTFAKPKLSKSKALSIAAPKARSIFGIDLKGYSVRIKDNEYTFTKKGVTTLIGTINKKGAFYSFEAIPSKGERN